MHVLGILGLAVTATSCTDSAGIINPSDVKIFVNNTQGIDVLATGITAIGNNDFMVFGVCGNAPKSRFDGNGSIYLRKINSLGKTEWDTCFSITGNSGFPTNLVRVSDNSFTFFWNDFATSSQQMVSFELNPGGATFQVPQTEFDCNFNCGVVMFASQALEADQFNLLGVGFDPISNLSTTFISKFNPSLGENQARSQRTFFSERFGGVGQNDLNLLKSIDNYLFLTLSNNRLLFTAPLADKMVMSHVGETSTFYQDELFWISALEKLTEEPDKAAVVISSPNRPDNPSFLIPEISLDKLPVQMNFSILSAKNHLLEMFDLDIQFKIFIMKLVATDNLVVAGTSRTGQPVVYVYDGSGLKSKEIGNTNQYTVGGIAHSGDGQEFVLVGITKIENRDQRLFWIKIDINELLLP